TRDRLSRDDLCDRCEILFEMSIERLVDLVEPVISGMVDRAGFRRVLDLNRGAAGFRDRRVEAGSYARQQRGAERGTLVHGNSDVRMPGHIRLYLPPDLAARAARS